MTNRWQRLQTRLHRNPVTGALTKAVVTLIGVGVLAAGVVMMVAPGPGVVGILLGLAILATEWHWARRLLTWVRDRVGAAADRARSVDPGVRRRRILLAASSLLALTVAVVAWVGVVGWPAWAVRGWNWVQSFSSLVPELPGM